LLYTGGCTEVIVIKLFSGASERSEKRSGQHSKVNAAEAQAWYMQNVAGIAEAYIDMEQSELSFRGR